MIDPQIKLKNKQLPETPGVYLMKDAHGKILYVGKAVSLKRRVMQYFTKPHGEHIEEMMLYVRAIDWIPTGTAIEALILEANLIKHYWPKYNILQKDNKSFLYLVFTNEDFPKPLLIRGTDLEEGKKYKKVFGPYTSGLSLRAALELVRKVFPWSTCTPGQKRPCFYVHLKQCPGVCIGTISKKEYAKIIRDLIKFFEGKKDFLLRQYRREMKTAAKQLKFEQAAELRRKIRFLEHIQDVAIMKREESITPPYEGGDGGGGSGLFGRIEGYDISNISGTSSVGSMVVFENGAPNKSEYRKFRIKLVKGSNDVASLQEVLFRRFRNVWRKPKVILIDGGLPQVHAAETILQSLNISIPLVGIAKGPERKRNDLFFSSNADESFRALCLEHHTLLEKVRDEAHRFAITYHRNLRRRTSLR
ncbi:excinuclease ABC subunit UvrC [Candidatus Uhrbacteria bacterium]|nr:excinuclease ABC subunit UvrC [Candidatus Uhrbacteria bacterium]